MARTSSIYDHFDLYLTPMTLTFNLPENMFQMALLLLEDNNCAKLFWNLCTLSRRAKNVLPSRIVCKGVIKYGHIRYNNLEN